MDINVALRRIDRRRFWPLLALFVASLAYAVLTGPFSASAINQQVNYFFSGPPSCDNGLFNGQPASASVVCSNADCSASSITVDSARVKLNCPSWNETSGVASCSISTFNAGSSPLGSDSQSVLISAGGPIANGQFPLNPFTVSGFDGLCSYQIDVLGATYQVAGSSASSTAAAFDERSQATTRQAVPYFVDRIRQNSNLAARKWQRERRGQRRSTPLGEDAGPQLVPIANGMRFEGLAAGETGAYPWGIWGTYQRSEFDDDSATRTYDASSDQVQFGFDVSPWDNAVIGISGGYENADYDTRYNGGQVGIDGFTVAPYFGALIGDALGIDAFDLGIDVLFGYSSLDVKGFRTTGGTRIDGRTDSERWFFSTNLNASRSFGDLYLSGLLGTVLAWDRTDAFTESDGTFNARSDGDFGQLRVGADVAYALGAFEPYASAIYQYDYQQQNVRIGSSNDDSDARVGLGLRYFGTAGWTGNFEWSRIVGRQNYDEDTYSVQLRGEF